MQVTREQREKILQIILPMCELIEAPNDAYLLTQLIVDVFEEGEEGGEQNGMDKN
uniref:Uncharacterized protein n=1 Tax=viral metagenome TaxID=1070528 RepID=A0A6M3JKF5_9ZZZZ